MYFKKEWKIIKELREGKEVMINWNNIKKKKKK
jgi:hypothetical protein